MHTYNSHIANQNKKNYQNQLNNNQPHYSNNNLNNNNNQPHYYNNNLNNNQINKFNNSNNNNKNNFLNNFKKRYDFLKNSFRQKNNISNNNLNINKRKVDISTNKNIKKINRAIIDNELIQQYKNKIILDNNKKAQILKNNENKNFINRPDKIKESSNIAKQNISNSSNVIKTDIIKESGNNSKQNISNSNNVTKTVIKESSNIAKQNISNSNVTKTNTKESGKIAKQDINDDNVKIQINKIKNNSKKIQVIKNLNDEENLKKNYDNNFLRSKSLSELVSNKRVIIVGPANYLSNIRNKEFIESFDVVVRINRSIPVPKNLEEFIGKRTDILVSNLHLAEYGDDIPIKQKTLERAGVKLIYCPYPKILPFINDQKKYLNGNYNNFNVEWIDSLFYRHLEYILNTRPNSGIITLLTLLRNNVKELFVTGFSFYNDGYYKGYKNKRLSEFKKNLVVRHNQDSQINLIKELYLKNNLLKIDSTMVGIIYKNLINFINKYFTKIDELFYKLNYKFSIPKFIKKYNREKSNNILILFSNGNFSQMINHDIFNIVIHKNKNFKDIVKSVYICNENMDINLFNALINTRNKGNIYLQKINLQYLKIIDDDNAKYILNHNYMLNGNIFIKFANILATIFSFSNNNYDILFILFSLIFDIEKKATIFLSNKDLELNNLLELKNFLGKNLFVKFI